MAREDRRNGRRPFRSYLLDTDTLSELVRRPDGRVAHRIAAVGAPSVFTSVVVAGELRYGAARSGSVTLVERVSGILEHLEIASLAPAVALDYARIRAALTAAGTPIGPNDLWIAAHARRLGATVVTGNEREFRRVPDLQVENWLDP